MTLATSWIRALALGSGLALSAGMLAACEEEGPAEKAGESLDNAVEQAGEDLEKAGDAVRDATQN